MQGEMFTTGTGQQLGNVHPRATCGAPFCVVHNPCLGPWTHWPTHWRGDQPGDTWRGFERVCPCGVGHPAVEEIMRGTAPGTHACCGKCPCHPSQAVPLTVGGRLVGYAQRPALKQEAPTDQLERYREVLLKVVEIKMALDTAAREGDHAAAREHTEALWRQIRTMRHEWEMFAYFLVLMIVTDFQENPREG